MRRHDVDPFSLFFGLLFTVVGLVLLTGDPARGSVSLAWAGPAVAIGLGLLVVLAARPQRDKPVDQEPTADEG
jgi:hypothetical protein